MKQAEASKVTPPEKSPKNIVKNKAQKNQKNSSPMVVIKKKPVKPMLV